jgi:hypothetical protein
LLFQVLQKEEIEAPLYQKVLDVLGKEEAIGAIDIWKN